MRSLDDMRREAVDVCIDIAMSGISVLLDLTEAVLDAAATPGKVRAWLSRQWKI